MTGAAVADTAAFGNTLVPAMVKEGYKRPFSCAVTVAGSIIGPTIPPSNLMVIYGSLMGVSIAGLFAAGIILAHQDWSRMKCGSGMSVATAYGAIKAFSNLRS